MSDQLPEPDLAVYAIRISPTASAQATAEYDRLANSLSADAAEEWRQGPLTSWGTLATFPLRCPTASENPAFQEFAPGPPQRVFLYRRPRRRSVWRILFTVHDTDANDPPTVRVHQIRHSAQATLTDWQPVPGDAS